jgi:hypothetical protein
MAIVRTTIDDLDGSVEDVETIHFYVWGEWHQIDLSRKNAESFADVLLPYIKVSRPSSQLQARAKTTTAGGSPAAPRDREKSADVREWAKDHGYKIPSRGRIPQSVVDAYNRAHESVKEESD